MTKRIDISQEYIRARADETAAHRAHDATKRLARAMADIMFAEGISERTAGILDAIMAEAQRLEAIAGSVARETTAAASAAAARALGCECWDGVEDIEPSEYDVRGSEEVEP